MEPNQNSIANEPSATLQRQVLAGIFAGESHGFFAVQRSTGRLVVVNGAAARILGRARDDLIGAEVAQILVADGPGATDVNRHLDQPGLHEDVQLRRCDGRLLYVALHVFHIPESVCGPLIACVAADNTERLLLERDLIAKHTALYAAHLEIEQYVRDLRAAKARLQQQNIELKTLGGELASAARRAAIGELSAGIAHSINNPMGALASALRQIEKRIGETESAALSAATARYFERGRQAVARLEEIVATVRCAHRSGQMPSTPRCIELADQVDLALALFEFRLREIAVRRDYCADTCAWAPPDAVHHVVSNLFENAIQAMPSGGELHVTIARDEHVVRVRVADTGHGIHESVAGTLFDPFVSGRVDGAGLGLSMAKRLARLWGGDVMVVPAERGAALEFSVPRRQT